ncbi:MAG TPA: TAXI family TRAP transporter solute-binding subunit [Casimicrobiaceae bacterium]|nr:TAXI family TRAP transporter solute-binding subunit [Casimicrobiaceae bacterium]
MLTNANGHARRATLHALVAAAIAGTLPLTALAQAITLLTGRSSSVHHPLGVALGTLLRKSAPPLKPSVKGTKGTAESLEELQQGRADIAFALGDTLSDAWKGREDAGFRAPLTRLRSIAALFPNYIQVVARADAGIRTLAGLRGKHVSVGVLKSGIELDARAIFAAAGLRYPSFGKIEYLPFGESVELMKNRQLDATLQSALLGVSGLRDLATSVDIVVIAIPADVLRKIDADVYLPAVIPADTYRGQTKDVATVAIQNVLVTHEGVADDTVYAVTKTLWTSIAELTAAHPAAKAMDPSKALAGIVIPLHPGAERYYRELGVVK